MRRGDRIGNTTAGVLALLAVAIGSWFAFGFGLPFQDPYTVKAVFRSANNLRVDSTVRIAGIDVGKVTSIDRVAGEEAAVVEMELNDQARPLHRDARFAIRPRVLLEGNFFVDVRPGTSAEGELGDGDTVPIDQTSGPVQLNQVLEPLAGDNREKLQTLLREAGRGLKGGSAGFNRSIPWWEDAYRDTAVVSGAIERDLAGFMRSAGRVSRALDESPEALKALIADFDTTAAAFAAEEDNLRTALGELPRLLREARPTLDAANAAFPPLRELAAEARPGVRASAPALRAALPLTEQLAGLVREDELRGLSADLAPLVPDLAELTRRGLPLLRQARPAASCAAEIVLPWSQDTIEDDVFPALGPVYTELPKTLGGVAGESKSGDANGQWIRVLFGAGNYAYPAPFDRFMLTTQPLMGVNPPPPDKRPPFRPDVPCETQQPPDLRSIPAPPPEGFKIDNTSSAALALSRRGLEPTTKWVRGLLDRPGLRGTLGVDADTLLGAADVPKLRRAVP